MKDAAKLFAYFAAVVVGGAILAPLLYWGAAGLMAHGVATFLSRFDFESFFHRALLICALAFLWPLLRALRVHSMRDLGLERDGRAAAHAVGGWLIAVFPLAVAAVVLVAVRVFLLKTVMPWGALAGVAGAAIIVPLIEEWFFRGLLLGVLLRDVRPLPSALITSAFFAVLHFLKAPASTSESVTWFSGFRSIEHSLSAFADPIMVLAAFALLFLLGWILADMRLRTGSLWLPIGLHSGWIFASGAVSKMTKHATTILPWLGPNLLVGVLPIALALLTWATLIVWLNYAENS